MVTHWESSRRPLYVRTVWKDGQHHVILDKTKENPMEISQPKKTKQSGSNQNSHRSAKSANTAVNLKISSVRVLFSGANDFRNTQKSAREADKSRILIKPAASRPVTSKNLNKEVTFSAVQGIKAPNLRKASTVDSGYIVQEKSPESTSQYAPSNSLSEKVLIWLDLAIQNGHAMKLDKPVSTQACQLLEKPRKVCEAKDELTTQDVIFSSILKNNTPRQSSEKEEIIVYSNEEVDVLEDFHHVLSSSVEEADAICDEQTEDKKKNRVPTAKRQLHIFMPNLPKKFIDCDSSILSSKIS